MRGGRVQTTICPSTRVGKPDSYYVLKSILYLNLLTFHQFRGRFEGVDLPINSGGVFYSWEYPKFTLIVMLFTLKAIMIILFYMSFVIRKYESEINIVIT